MKLNIRFPGVPGKRMFFYGKLSAADSVPEPLFYQKLVSFASAAMLPASSIFRISAV
jgi:hypothetical protein